MGGGDHPLFCPKCSDPVSSRDRICPKCGAPVDDVSRTLTSGFTAVLKDEDWERFSPGNIFANRYTIIEEIGHGGMGRVFKALDRSLGITVAIKVIRPEFASNPRVIELFKQETVLARSISSENVVRVHDLGEAEKTKYISMDFVEGQNLRDLIHASGSLTISTAVKFGQQICSALSAAHKAGIIHRDLKPSNIMIDKTGRVRVMDFGLAKTIDREDIGGAKAIVGTPEYLSPEQARGENLDQRTDIYALGLVLYEMVTGRPVFEAESLTGYIQKHCEAVPKPPSRVNHTIPAGLETLILKCLRKDRNERYQKAEDVCKALDGVIAPESRKPKTARSRLLRISVGAAACALIGLIAFFIISRPGRPPVPSIRKSVAVMSFENMTGDPSRDYLRPLVQNLLILDLELSKYLRLISRETLLQCLKDFHVEDTGIYALEDLNKITSRENVDFFLLGSFMMHQEAYRIDIRIVDARWHETIASWNIDTVALPEIQDRCGEISLWAKQQLGLSQEDMENDFNEELKKYMPHSPEAVMHFLQGIDFYAKGDFKQSSDSYLKAVAIDKGFALAYARLAMNSVYEGRFEEAEKHILKAWLLRKNLPLRERLLIEGDYYNFYESDYPSAIARFDTLLTNYPRDKIALEHQGAIYRNIEEWDKAKECFQTLLAVNPKNNIAIDNLSYIAQAMGQYDLAAGVLQDNKSVFPTPDQFPGALAFCLFCQGRPDQALVELEKAISYAPDWLGYTRHKGQIHSILGNFREAEAAYQPLMKEEREDSDKLAGRYWLGHLFLLKGQYRNCLGEIEEGLKLARKGNFLYEEIAFLLFKSRFHLLRGDFARASETALKAGQRAIEIRYREGEVQALHLKGLGEVGLGRIFEARRTVLAMEQIINKIGYPKLLRTCYHLGGTIACARKSWDEAVNDLEKAVNTLPHQYGENDQHAVYIEALASSLYQRGDLDPARAQYEKIISLTTGRLSAGDAYARSLYRLGIICQEKKEPEKAREYFQRFLDVLRNADAGLPDVEDARKRLDSAF